MPFPSLDPVIFEIGPFALRWYALAYIAGLMLGWRYVIMLSQSRGFGRKARRPAARRSTTCSCGSLLASYWAGVWAM